MKERSELSSLNQRIETILVTFPCVLALIKYLPLSFTVGLTRKDPRVQVPGNTSYQGGSQEGRFDRR